MEIAMARLALSRTKNADVKEYANMMITEHGRMKSEGAELAARLGIVPAPAADDPSATQADGMIEQLQITTDTDAFDRMYINQMVISHQQTIDFLNRAATTTRNDSLRAFIEKGRPVVQMHLQHAQDMMGKVGGAVDR